MARFKSFVFFFGFLLWIGCGENPPSDIPTIGGAEAHPHHHEDHHHEDHHHEDHHHEAADTAYASLILAAESQMGTGDYESATLTFLNAVRSDSGRVEAYYGIGFCFSRMKNYVKATEYFNRVMFIDPDYRETRMNRGICRIKSGDLNAGIADLTVSIEKEGQCSFCYINRALGYRELGEIENMCDDLEKAIALGDSDAGRLFKIHCKG